MQPVKIAVVGAGQPNIATNNHLPAMQRLDNVEITCLCDINADGVREYAEKFNAKWTTSFEDVLDDPDIDAVDICTPDWLHCDQVIAAARAGKHILCEKPIAMSMEEAHAMADAVETAGVVFMAAHVRRFQPMSQAIKAILDRGDIGDIVYARFAVKGAFFPYPKGSRYYKKEAKGQFLHNGPHYVDTLCYWVDSEPLRVHGTTRSYYPNPAEAMETANYTAATIRFANGAIGSVEQNLTMLKPRGYPTREQILIIGSKATIEWNSHDDATLMTYSNGLTAFSDPQPIGRVNDPFQAEIAHFADCIQTGQQPISGMPESLSSLSICLQALGEKTPLRSSQC